MNLPEFSDGANYYAVIYNGEILAYDKNELHYNYDGHLITINNDGIYYDNEIICENQLMCFTVFRNDNVSSETKIIDYLNDIPWDYDYDYDYYRK